MRLKLILSTLALAGCVGLLQGKPRKMAPDVDVSAADLTDVIIQYREDARPLLGDKVKRLRNRGGLELGRLNHANATVMRLSRERLAELEDDPDVIYVSPDRAVKAAQTQPSPESAGGIYTTKFGWTGAGIGVAVIDSGLRTEVEDTKGRVVHMESMIAEKPDPKDSFGHGTHVGGIIGSSGSKSKGAYAGVAPGVNLVNLRVLDDRGVGVDSSVIAAIDRAIALKSTYNIRVINISLGRPIFESCTLDPLCRAVERAWRAGIVVVVAAGNHGRNNLAGNKGYGTVTSPGNSPYVITVGAMRTNATQTRTDDVMASYSSKGPTLIDNFAKPDLVSPGNLIVSNDTPGDSYLYKQRKNNRINTDYFRLSGTSMAAPMVSGTVALMLQKDPSLTPDQVKARLMRTSTKTFPKQTIVTDGGQTFTINYDLFTVGAGYLDIAAALSDSTVATGSALSPKVVRSADGTVRMVNDPNAVWGSSIIWGESVVWGESVIWGESVVWGSSIIWGESVIWGTNGLGKSSVIWGENTGLGPLTMLLDGEQ